jgi:hypothetical protein
MRCLPRRLLAADGRCRRDPACVAAAPVDAPAMLPLARPHKPPLIAHVLCAAQSLRGCRSRSMVQLRRHKIICVLTAVNDPLEVDDARMRLAGNIRAKPKKCFLDWPTSLRSSQGA